MKLDQRTIASLELPEGKDDVIFWDADLAGFGLRLRRRGDRVGYSWCVQYRNAAGRTRRVSMTDTLTAIEARARRRASSSPRSSSAAIRRVSGRSSGDRPAGTLRSIITQYLDARRPKPRPASYRVTKMYLTGDYFKTLHAVGAATIVHADVAAALRRIEGESDRRTWRARRAWRCGRCCVVGDRPGLIGGEPDQPRHRHRPNGCASTARARAGRRGAGRDLACVLRRRLRPDRQVADPDRRAPRRDRWNVWDELNPDKGAGPCRASAARMVRR